MYQSRPIQQQQEIWGGSLSIDGWKGIGLRWQCCCMYMDMYM